MKNYLLAAFFLINLLPHQAYSQITIGTDSLKISYKSPQTYRIAAIKVEGVTYLDKDILVVVSGLNVGETLQIPSDKTTAAIKNLWKQGLFNDVQLTAERIEGNDIYLKLYLEERPRISRFAFSRNLKTSRTDNLNEEIKGYKGKIITQSIQRDIENLLVKYYVKKGYYNPKIVSKIMPDTLLKNSVMVRFEIDEGKKMKIDAIEITGNKALSTPKIKSAMKNTKDRNTFGGIFKGARFVADKFEEDKRTIVAAYQDLGYRDAKIAFDTIFTTTGVGYYMPVPNVFKIKMTIDEGKRYYFRNLTYNGNTLYPDSTLSKVVGIKKGDVYNQTLLTTRLYSDPAGQDVTTLYMDDGYLFFSLSPIETIENDSIDIEMRIREGAQATISSVTLVGNDRTSDHVVIREIRTRPGQKFNRSDIIRTTRELSQLGYFDPAQIDVVPTPNPNNGTVDIEYKVVERSNDQIELQGGWGPNARGRGTLVGSLGLTLNNFSAKKILDKKSWQPLPSGDGQRLSLRAQANGFFQSYNASFTEPWLGGKKPNAFTVGVFSSKQDYSSVLTGGSTLGQSIITRGASITLSKRLKWPDDYFVVSHGLSYQRYLLNNFPTSPFIQTGTVNNVFFTETISRNSIDQPIFPRKGAQITLTMQVSPPFSLLSKVDKTKLPIAQQYKWLEYNKFRFDASWYTKLSGNGKFVLLTKVQFGFLGKYNAAMGEIPFGRFFLGGDGLAGFNIDDREIIGLRGYKSQTGNGDQALTPRFTDANGNQGQFVGGTAFQKYTLEARYLLVPNPSSTIYVTGFLEAGNNFRALKDFDPFKNYRSAGVGARVFLPMFGLLGVDFGYGFDGVQGLPGANGRQIHISIGQQF